MKEEVWGDFLISRVRYDGNKIQKVRMREDQGDDLGIPTVKKRDIILNLLKNGYNLCTMRKVNDEWVKGGDLLISDDGFIKVEGRDGIGDDLGDISEF